RRINALKVLKAPRDGTVMSPPHKEDIFKRWEKADAVPFCSIGDTKRLRILLPVTPPDYRLIRENLDERGGRLEVLIHVPGRFDKVCQGWITKLPESDAKEVPVALTHRGGGSLAVKPSSDPRSDGRTVEPLVQTYLVAIDIEDPDPAFCPGTLVRVQVQN